jgi:uncharacterized membrane protein (DUF106 family)
MTDSRFKYQDLRRPGLTYEQLDHVFKSVMTPDIGIWSLIVAGVKLGLFVAYLFGRKLLIDQHMAYKKQEYELGRTGESQEEIDQDDLAGIPR